MHQPRVNVCGPADASAQVRALSVEIPWVAASGRAAPERIEALWARWLNSGQGLEQVPEADRTERLLTRAFLLSDDDWLHVPDALLPRLAAARPHGMAGFASLN